MNNKDEQGYNGWSNYETWATKLWIDNDNIFSNIVKEINQPKNYPCDGSGLNIIRKVAERIEGYFIKNNPIKNSSVYFDLLNAALRKVDWWEIADHIVNEQDE